MSEQKRYPQAISHFQAYLNCASIVMFVLCTTILIVAYSPLQWISPGTIANLRGEFGQILPLSLAAALVTSGIQITSMMSVRTKPSVLELSLFCTLHIVAFLAAYLTMGAMETVSPSGVISLVCILFAIVAPCCCFVYTRGKTISEAG
ncbi:hypothetical protein [Marinobacter sp. PE14]